MKYNVTVEANKRGAIHTVIANDEEEAKTKALALAGSAFTVTNIELVEE